jgi:hypothetical protein
VRHIPLADQSRAINPKRFDSLMACDGEGESKKAK